MKNIILYLILLFFSINLNAQHQADIWYFGQYAGIDFSSGSPVALTNSAMSQYEGCASISDKDGNLLFYTDGMNVWNRNHSIMQNGTGLMGNPSSTQSGIIVPKPDSDNLFYLFTVPIELSPDGLRYSVIDISLDNNLGAVTEEKNIFLISTTEEKVTAARHSNGIDFWVITHIWDSSDFYAYLITKDGIQDPIITSIGTYHDGTIGTHGYMKVSPNGKKLMLVVRKINSFELFNFDNETGLLSGTITFPYIGILYGIEFSPDNSKVYVGQYQNGQHIYQFDLSSNDPEIIKNSRKTVGTVNNIHLGALQLAPDNNIYVSKHDNLNGDNYLGVINNPNELGVDCNFVEDGFYLAGRKCIWGLPNFIQSFFDANFTYQPDCFRDSTWFKLQYSGSIDSVLWNFGDPASGDENFSNYQNPYHIFTSSGEFIVKVVIYSGTSEYPIEKTITILPSPNVYLGNDTTFCTQTETLLKAGGGFDSYLWQDNSTDSVFLVSQTGDYWVRVENSCGFAFDTIHIDYSSTFDINIGTDTSFCYGQSILLSPGGGYYSYYWQDGSNDSLLFAGTTGYYWVQVTDSSGCTAIDSIYIDAFMDFGFSLGPDTSVICHGDYIFLHAPNGYQSYLWQDGSNYLDFLADTAGIYWLEITDENNCAARDSVLLIVNKIPDDFLGNDTVMCENDYFDIHAPSYYDKYIWQDGSSDSVFIAWQTGDYWVYVEDSIGCSGVDTISLSMFQQPLLNHSNDTLICPTNSILLSPGSGMLYYLWNTGETDSLIIVNSEGDYWVEMGTNCGVFTDSVFVGFYSNPGFSLGPDTNICNDETIRLSAGSGFLNYLWSDGSNDSILIVFEDGKYSVLIDDGRCLLYDTVNVENCSLLWVPNVFTPNGDGFNDDFFAVGEYVEEFKMVIFNRWGQVLRTLYSIDEKWDGSFNGIKCADAVYYWKAEFVEVGRNSIKIKKTIQGSVTLIRSN